MNALLFPSVITKLRKLIRLILYLHENHDVTSWKMAFVSSLLLKRYHVLLSPSTVSLPCFLGRLPRLLSCGRSAWEPRGPFLYDLTSTLRAAALERRAGDPLKGAWLGSGGEGAGWSQGQKCRGSWKRQPGASPGTLGAHPPPHPSPRSPGLCCPLCRTVLREPKGQ